MILDGREVRKKIISEIRKKDLPKDLKIVDIVIINEANNLYIRNKAKACKQIGATLEVISLKESVSEQTIINLIKKCNEDKTITAIMVSLPLPPQFNQTKIINTIKASKDIDGLTNQNKMQLYSGTCALLPCTPKGILELLHYYNISLVSKNVVIIGRSKLIGEPLIPLLLKENATITICHSYTKDLASFTKKADILICAANKAEFITKEMVCEDAVIIDAATIYKNGQIVGNVVDDVSTKVKFITPVPGGVGPVTVAMFLKNALICYEKNKKSL